MVGINSRAWQLQYNICCRVSRPIGLAIGLLVQFRMLHTTERNEINNTESYLNLRTFRVGNFRTSNQINAHMKLALRIFGLGNRNSNSRRHTCPATTLQVPSDKPGPFQKPPITIPLLSAFHDVLHMSNFNKMLTDSLNHES
jgi:hypothetical protein